MNIYLSTNIKLLRKRKKMTQASVALAVKIKRSTFAGIEVGNSLPSIELLTNLSALFSISIDILIKNDLSKYSEFQMNELENGNESFIQGTDLRILTKTVSPQNTENIELVSEKARAGYALGYSDLEFIGQLPSFQLPFLSKNKKYRAFQVSGDSMLPISEKSWVICEYIQDWENIQNGNPYIFLTLDEGVIFKIVENLGNGKIKLYSLNKFYQPYYLKLTAIKEVWKFVNYISSEIPIPGELPNDIISRIKKISAEFDYIKQKIV